MRRRCVLALLTVSVLAWGGSDRAHAQFNPNGWINTDGWTFLFPLINPFGAAPPPSVMKESWIAPSQIGDPDFNPQADDQHGSDLPAIDFGGASPATGFDLGGLVPNPLWFTIDYAEGALSLPAGTIPRGDLINYNDNIAVWVTDNVLDGDPGTPGFQPNPLIPGSHPIPNDNVLGIAVSYVQNDSGAPVEVGICTASDDSIQVWVNNKCILNKSIPRGSAGSCQEVSPAILPTGVSKISVLVWEGGGGHNFRLGVIADGSQLTDGNGAGILFLGPNDGSRSGQAQYCLERTAAVKPFDCPNDIVKVTLTGSSPEGFTGSDDDVLTVVECVEASDPASIEITDVTNGGAVSNKERPDTTPEGSPAIPDTLGSTAFVGTDAGGGSSGTVDDMGTADPADDVYTSVSTSGGDLWTGCDSFQFQYSTVTGDFDISIEFLERTHATGVGRWGKFGLMARQTLDTNSRFFMIQDHLPDLQDSARSAGRREHGNCNSMFEVGGPIAHPRFIRLTRRGNTFSAWESEFAGLADGTLDPGKDCNWIHVHSEDWGDTAPADVLLGFANSEHNSDGSPAQTIRYRILSGHGAGGCPVIGKTVTWEVTRGDAGSGLMYNVRYGVPGSTRHAGKVEGETITSGVASIAFDPDQSGPVGPFDNSHDFGSPRLDGSTTDNGDGSVTVKGSGFDIWSGSGDNMHMAYRVVSGDFVATARVADVQHPDAGRWGRYGLMARHSCHFKARHAFAMHTAGNAGDGVDFPRHQFRPADRCNDCIDDSQQVNDGALAGFPGTGDIRIDRRPPWLRLVRRGNAIFSYMAFADQNGDPIKWCQTGVDSDPNRPAELLVGLAVGSHGSINDQTLVCVTFDSISIEPLDAADELTCTTSEALHDPLGFDDSADVGVVVVRGGAFTPAAVDGRLRMSEQGVGGTATAVWYGVPADPLAEGAPILSDGFVAEFDAFMTRDGVRSDPNANPADGFTFAVVATGANDGLATALAPFPAGLDVPSLGGDGGGSMGYNGGTIRARSECHPSFAIEMDNWVGGGNNEPGDAGSPNNDGNWHLGVDLGGYVDSIQTNVQAGVATGALPDIFSAAGVHVEVHYQASGRIDVYATANDGSVARTRVLSTQIAPLPAGDAVLGFTAGTGGATSRQEIDNFVVSTICCEEADSVEISGPSDAVSEGEAVTLAASVSGVDDGGAAACTFEIVEGGDIASLTDNGDCTASVVCSVPGTVVVRVTAGDGVCEDGVTAEHTITCLEPPGGLQLPGDCNQDSVLDTSDVLCILGYLFLGKPAVLPCGDATASDPANLELLDANGDNGAGLGVVDLADAIYLINRIVLGGPPHVLGEECVRIRDCPNVCVP